MQSSQVIASFFIYCLFNVAFIPQLCLSSVQELSQERQSANATGEEQELGFSLFEEESKEGQEEENKTGADSFSKVLNEYTDQSTKEFLFLQPKSSLTGFSYQQYKSLILTPLSPPPDLALLICKHSN